MKKVFLGFLILFGMISFFSFAQNIENISVKFCNDGMDKLTSRSTISINPGESKDICLYLENNGEIPAEVSYMFSDGNLTNWGTQTCSIKTGFQKFVPEQKERTILLSGHANKTVKETLQIPLGMSGMVYGCMTYTVAQPKNAKQGMFTVVIRKPIFLNLFIGGNGILRKNISLLPMTGGVFSTNSKIKAEISPDNMVTLLFNVQNKGNVSQNINLSGMLYNFLGFQKEFEAGVKKFMPGETKQITVNAGILPSYKGLYDIKLNVSSTPVFDFDPQGLDPELLKTSSFVETAKIFVFSWIRVIALVVIIAIVLKLFWPKSRKNIVATDSK